MTLVYPGHSPPDCLHFHAPQRHTAILVNGKVKEKKFKVHYTSESESSDPPSYVLPVCSAAPASPRSEFNTGDPNGKEKTSGPGAPNHATQRLPHYISLCLQRPQRKRAIGEGHQILGDWWVRKEGPQQQPYASSIRLPGCHYPRQMSHTRLDPCNMCISHSPLLTSWTGDSTPQHTQRSHKLW
jgi:hypothetical protein